MLSQAALLPPAFFGKGKKAALTIKRKPDFITTLKAIGSEFSLSEIPAEVEEAVCAIYSTKRANINNVHLSYLKPGAPRTQCYQPRMC